MSALYRQKIVSAAYRYCQAVTDAHYENFPVASVLLPKRLRPAIAAIYAFSRIADDFADEAEFAGERLEQLEAWENLLTDDNPTHPVFVALSDATQQHDLPRQLFYDLLSAFKQDVVKARYANFDEILDYCRRSADPVGRLVLSLFKLGDVERFKQSDAVCTALQLANFWQDVAIDLKKDRIYLPQDDMAAFGVSEDDLKRGQATDGFKKLMTFQIARTRELFARGKPLGLSLPGRLGVEIRLTWLTGMRILDRIESVDYDVFNHRPELSKRDFLRALPAAFFRNHYGKLHVA